VFPVKYGLYLHISFGRNSVFKGLKDNYVRSFTKCAFIQHEGNDISSRKYEESAAGAQQDRRNTSRNENGD
jgi:hypothetical protein